MIELNYQSRLLLVMLFIIYIGFNPILNNLKSPSITSVVEVEAQSEPTPIKLVNQEHLKCVATAIYHEAKNEPFMGQVAVARVIMNRVTHGFASNPCRVVYQTAIVKDSEDPEIVKKLCQFSWVCAGIKTPSPTNAHYRRAEEIARQVLAENKWNEVMPNNVLFFHSTSVNPEWPYKRSMTLGNHVFYSKGKEKSTK